MAKKKRKQILNAALKALLAGVETSAAIKIPATFISELAALPDDKQKALAELPQEQFNALLTQSELATLNAAEAAAGTKQIKALIKELIEKIDKSIINGSCEQERTLIHNLLYPSIGDLFKGRDDILKKLKSRLDDNKPTAITQAIEGLGGIGKTRLAIEFGWWVWENKKAPAVFFVSAETPERLRASLATLAADALLDLPGQKEAEQINAILHWLNDNPGWLMILDNADTEDAAEAVEDLMPRLANGRVIITSRYKRWSASVKPHSLDLLPPKQATQFLLDRTADRRIQTDDDKKLAGQLAKELGYLPLALEQAAAYISHNQYSFADYLHQWDSERQNVLEWYDKRQMQYPASVAVTWQRTFEQLGPPSRALLRLSAFLAPEMIPSKMFENSIDIFKEAVELLTGKKPAKKSKLKIDDILSELAAYSMITRQKKGFTVHRILQEVIRSRIPEESKADWIKKALRIVNNFTPTDSDDFRTWPVLDVLRPHAELIAETADQAQISEPTSRLMNQLGLYLKTKGLYNEAEPLFLRALKIDEASFVPDHPIVAIRLNNLANLLQATGRLSEAEPMYRRALKINEASFGPDHPSVARALNNLADLLRVTNRLSEAEPLMHRALKIDEASFGPDHPNVARDLNNLAGLLQDTNRLSEVEPLMRRVVEIFEKSLGQNHPNLAIALNNLAELLRITNRFSEAEPMYRRALKIDEASFGPDHPQIAIRLNNLAQLLKATDCLSEAESLMRRGLVIEESSKGPNHPHVAIQLNNLAALLTDTNRLSEAEPMMRRALKIDEASFGPDHPNVAIRLNNLAALLRATNRLSEAEPMYRRALKICEDSLGPDHPTTQTIRNNLQTLK